jgi:hypothetical protein
MEHEERDTRQVTKQSCSVPNFFGETPGEWILTMARATDLVRSHGAYLQMALRCA